MANLNESLRNMNFDSAATKGSTDVTVSAFGNNALKGILEAISRQSSIITSLEDEVETLRTTQTKQNTDNRKEDRKNNLASDASNRKSRATEAAMYGEIKKGNVASKLLKDALVDSFKALGNIVANNFKKSLSSIDNLTQTLRKSRLSTEAIVRYNQQASEMFGKLSTSGFNISRNEINNAISELTTSGKDVEQMFKDGTFEKYVLARHGGANEKNATSYMHLDDATLKKLANQSYDPAVTAALSRITEEMDQNTREFFGGINGYTNAQIDITRGLVKNIGNTFSADAIAEITKSALKIQSGNYGNVAEDDIVKLLGLAGTTDLRNMKPEELGKRIAEKMITANSGERKILLQMFNGNAEIQKSIEDTADALKNGTNIGVHLKDKDEIENAKGDYTEGGKLQQWSDKIVSGIDSLTGGLFSQISGTINEFFGPDLTMEQLVSNGFKTIITILTAMLAGKFLGGFTSKITSLIGGLGTKLGGPLGKIVGLLGVGGGIAGGGDDLDDLLDTDDVDEPDKKKKKKKKSKKKGKSKAGKGKGKLGKLSKLGKAGSKIAGGAAKVGAKAIPVAGIAIAAADSAVDLYDAFTWEAESLAVESSSAAFKKMEEGINQSTKNGKVAAATAGAIGTFGGMAAGAAIGSAVPIVGTAIGAVVGLGVGAISSAIADAHESLNNTKLHIENVKDLENGLAGLEKCLETEKDPLRIEELKKAIAEQKSNLEFARNAQAQDLVDKFASKNEDFMTNSGAMSQIGDRLAQSIKEEEELQNKINDWKARGYDKDAIATLEGKLASKKDESLNYRRALTGLAGGEFKIKENEALEDAIKRISDDVKGDTWLGREDKEADAAEGGKETFEKFMKEQALDKLTNGVFVEALDHLKKQEDVEVIAQFVKNSNLGAGLSEDAIKDLTKEVIKQAKGEDAANQWFKKHAEEQDKKPVDVNLKPNALGGIYTNPTASLIGEDGKEAVLPLTKPDQLLNIMNKLTTADRSKLLKSILSSSGFSFDWISSIIKSFSGSDSAVATQVNKANVPAQLTGGDVPGDDPATIRKILSFAGPFSGFVYNLLLHGKNGKYKNAFEQRKKWYAEALQNAAIQDGHDLIRGTYAERALDWGVTQLGKPYILRSLGKIGYVCNELTDAALRASGFDMKDFHIYGVSATFDKLKSGKRSKLKRGDRKGELEEFPDFRIRDDLTIDTATPGMLFFQVAKGKSNPGHIGLVYYGHQKLHSSGGSANYTKGGFLTNWQTPCRGVTVTPPKPGEQYIIGELPGLFAQANGEFKLPEGANFGPGYNSSASTEIESAKLAALVDESIFTNSASLHDFISQFIGTDYQNLQASSVYSELVADYESAIADIAASSSLEAKRNAIEFSKSALSLLGNKRTSPEILEALSTMIKYLRDIALSPANKKAITPVSRPVNASFA